MLRVRGLGLGLGLGLLLGVRLVGAAPQGNVALTVGVAGRGLEGRLWEQTVFQLGLRGDLMLGRTASTSFGVGPYLEVSTLAFDEFQFGGGVSTLFPLTQAMPIVLSVGAYGRHAPQWGVEPGLVAALFFGSRSYNYHSSYGMTAGLLAQFRYGLGASGETSIVVGAQLDLLALTLPFQMLINAIRGGSHATDPVK